VESAVLGHVQILQLVPVAHLRRHGAVRVLVQGAAGRGAASVEIRDLVVGALFTFGPQQKEADGFQFGGRFPHQIDAGGLRLGPEIFQRHRGLHCRNDQGRQTEEQGEEEVFADHGRD